MKHQTSNIHTSTPKLRVLNRIAQFQIRERFYKDGNPQWRVGKKDKPCETSEEAEKCRRIAVNRLRRLSRESSDDVESDRFKGMADLIKVCRPYDRCQHPACPRCLRALQGWFVRTAPTAMAIASRSSGGRLAAVCIIPDLRLSLTASIKHTRDQVTRVLALIGRALDPLTGVSLVGGIDISVNEPLPTKIDGKRVERVQIHIWVLGPEDQIRAVEPWLRKCFPTGRAAKAPVKIKPWDGDLRAFAYALKTQFFRRVSLPPTIKNGRRRRRNTRIKPLNVRQWGRVMLILEMIGTRRIILVGAKTTKTRRGRLVIRPQGT